MEARKNLEKAREIIKHLEDNTYQAIMYGAFFERVTFEGDIGEAFGESRETWGVVKSQEAFFDALVLCLSRMIKGKGENTASLFNLVKLLEDNEVVTLLEEEAEESARKRGLAFVCDKADAETRKRWEEQHREEQIRRNRERVSKNIKELQELVNKLSGSHITRSVFSYRNTKTGHIAIKLDPKKHVNTKYGDVTELLQEVVPIVDLASAIVTGVSIEFLGYFEEAKYAADKFWRHAAHLEAK